MDYGVAVPNRMPGTLKSRRMAISELAIDLGAAKLMNGAGVFVFTDDGFAGEGSVGLEITASDDISFDGTFGLAFNNTGRKWTGA